MDYDNEHRKHLLSYLQQIERLFYEWVGFSVSLALKTDFKELIKNALFSFDTVKKKKALDRELANFSNQLDEIIKQGISNEWVFANLKQDKQLRAGLTKYQNLEALETFKNRKIKDFTVSDRVWDIAKKAQTEIELALSVSLEEGKSAVQLSREVRNLLNNPTALFRRVRDKYGNLVLSKNAQNYHPGQGVYRSAYKNALRLASNEINVAYKSADWLRIQQNPDIVGFEVRLSPQHKVYDMCDELKGKYPKSFKFHGWHVGCKCHIVTILKTDEELIKELKADETLPPESSSNYVGDVPSNYKQWVTDNKDRFKNWKTKPYFIGENTNLYTPKKEGKVTIAKNYDKNDFKRNKEVANICAKQTGFDFHIREHIEKDGLTNPEYLINDTFLGDRKSLLSNDGILTQIDLAKKQMLNSLINPNKIPYYIVWDLDEVKDINWERIKQNISRKVTNERGKYIAGMFFQYKGKAVHLSKEEILNRAFHLLDTIK